MPWQKSFQLKEFEDFWRLSPVKFYHGYGSLDLQKSLLDKGRKKDFPEWESYTRTAVSKDEFYVGSSPMHYALIDVLCENEDHPIHKDLVEKIREFLEQQLQRPLLTLSKTTYRPLPDHDFYTHVQGNLSYTQPEHLFGSNGHLHTLWDAQRISTAFFAEADPQRVNKVTQWLSKQDVYVTREKTKVNAAREKCACVARGNPGLHLCINVPMDKFFPALGMRIRALREVDH